MEEEIGYFAAKHKLENLRYEATVRHLTADERKEMREMFAIVEKGREVNK